MRLASLILALVCQNAIAHAQDEDATASNEPITGKKQRLREPAVFVDGVPIAVLHFGELPPGLKTKWIVVKDETDQRKVRRYVLAEYLKELGVPLDKVKAVHLYGGKRVAPLTGDEFRKWKDQILFSFSQGTKGKPQMMWPDNKPIKNGAPIDMLTAIAVYVDKPAPTYDKRTKRVIAEGKAYNGLESVPYQQDEVRNGVRIYRDGRLLAVIKRNKLKDVNLVPGSDVAGDPRWTLVPYLTTLGVSLDGVKKVDLIYEEGLAKRIEPKELAGKDFSMVPDKSGEILVHPWETKVAAILLYAKTTPNDSR